MTIIVERWTFNVNPLRRFNVKNGVSLRRTLKGIFSFRISVTPGVTSPILLSHLLFETIIVVIYVIWIYNPLGLLTKLVFLYVCCHVCSGGEVWQEVWHFSSLRKAFEAIFPSNIKCHVWSTLKITKNILKWGEYPLVKTRSFIFAKYWIK